MTDRKLCGFDLNGWRDFVAKNWHSVPGEDEIIGPTDIVPSGPLSSIVRIGEGRRAGWIGGPQADIAPHGRGGGWGDVGSEQRRIPVRSLLEMRDDGVEKLAQALVGSASGSANTVVSIDEGPDGDEALQEHLLEALAQGKFRNGSLVWRPVLAALFAIHRNQVEEGQLVPDPSGSGCADRSGRAAPTAGGEYRAIRRIHRQRLRSHRDRTRADPCPAPLDHHIDRPGC